MKRHPGMFLKGYDPRRFDYSPLNKARTGVPVSIESKIKRLIANQDKEKRMVFKEIIKWLKENIVEPELHENGNNGDIVNIWFMIMNYGYKNQVENPENIERIVKFVSYIQHYLPERFRDAELSIKRKSMTRNSPQNSRTGSSSASRNSRITLRANTLPRVA